MLSEAYSYADFQTRIAATRAFVLTVLGKAAADRDKLRATCERADRRLVRPDAPQYFGFDSAFGDPEFLPVLVGEVDRIDLPDGVGTRLAMKSGFTTETMPVVRRFRARQQIALPFGWALADAEAAVLDALQLQGIVFEKLAEPRRVVVQQFAVTNKRKPGRPYQGHQELQLSGTWQPEATIELPAGTTWIPGGSRGREWRRSCWSRRARIRCRPGTTWRRGRPIRIRCCVLRQP
ncbi:MAG: hypothetical protein IPK26_19830 [Planctomycetes bacterium]|nr:hypothetical protein [Planctomycetota bacterium]